MDIDYVVRILKGCDYYTTVGMQNLKDRCLITINEKNKLMMHQLLRDMGREIVRRESPDDPGKCSRLWHSKDAFYVLKEKTGTESIKGLKLNLSILMQDMQGQTTATAKCAKRHYNDDSSDKVTIPHLSRFSKRRCLGLFSWRSSNSASVNLFSPKSFAKMQKLKLLHLNDVQLRGDYEGFPRSLVWLYWHGFPLNSIPVDLCLDKLAVLDMRNSNLKHVWNGIRFLGELKILNLSHSHGLVRTPNFTGLPRLEKLLLKYCVNLVEVDESIGNLKRLVLLNLKCCESLKKLPGKLSMLRSLEELIISGCLNLCELPKVLGELESLRMLHADRVPINREQLSSTQDFRESLSLWHPTFWNWLLPKRFAQSTSLSLAFLPRSLVNLSLADCSLSDIDIPKDLSCLPFLRELNLSDNPISCLPESINRLTMLYSLELYWCKRLHSLPELPTSLCLLRTDGCTSLERIGNYHSHMSNLSDLSAYGSGKLVEVGGFFKLEPINSINLEILNNLGLLDVESLKTIEVEMYNTLTCTTRKTKIQVLHECGIFSIFLPGTEIPDWFCHQNKGPSISFNVPSIVDHNINGVSLCILYTFNNQEPSFEHKHCVEINNKTKGVTWTYIPIFFGIPKADEGMLWLSYWMLEDQLEGGDEVQISMDIEFGLHVKECGIRVMHDQKKNGAESHCKEIVRTNSVWHKMKLCHFPFWEFVHSKRNLSADIFTSYYSDPEVAMRNKWAASRASSITRLR